MDGRNNYCVVVTRTYPYAHENTDKPQVFPELVMTKLTLFSVAYNKVSSSNRENIHTYYLLVYKFISIYTHAYAFCKCVYVLNKYLHTHTCCG